MASAEEKSEKLPEILNWQFFSISSKDDKGKEMSRQYAQHVKSFTAVA